MDIGIERSSREKSCDEIYFLITKRTIRAMEYIPNIE
jgi:hypothetical protein